MLAIYFYGFFLVAGLILLTPAIVTVAILCFWRREHVDPPPLPNRPTRTGGFPVVRVEPRQ